MSEHDHLQARYGDRFAQLVARPRAAIERVMSANGWGLAEATNFLIQAANDEYPTQAAAAVAWLRAARVEIERSELCKS